MTITTTAKPIIPALAGIYEKTSRLGEPLVRATAGVLLMPHGAQKLFGWFGGYGIEGTGGYFAEKLGLVPGVFWAGLVGGTEFFGGLLLALGLLTRPSAAAITILMAVAILRVHIGNGFFAVNSGYEFPLFWGLVAFAFVLRGGGAFSIDAKIGREF
jgi:putative oxidoreductase